MRPVITDADTGRTLWRIEDCANHCDITPATWRSYVLKHMPPEPVARLGTNPLWDAEAVRDWHANRPRRT